MENLNEKAFELLEKTGLNWTVNREQLFSKSGAETKSFGLFRNDNGGWLSTVGPRYVPFQNYQLAEHIIQATEGLEIPVTRGGSLKNGRLVYLQAELPAVHIGNSDVNRWITGTNTHSDERSIGFGSTNTVIICQNTYHRAYGDLSKFRHAVNANDRISEFLKGLRKAIGLEEDLIKKFQIMADLPLRDEVFANVMKACFDFNPDALTSTLSTQQKNKAAAVAGAIETEIKLEGKTLWGLFNGITRYTNHVATKPEKRDEYIMTGAGYEMSNTAFETIMDYIERNTVHPVYVEL